MEYYGIPLLFISHERIDSMLKKNLELYRESFKRVSSNQFTRIKDFLSTKTIPKKFQKNLFERIEEISRIDTQTLKIIFYIIPESTPRPRLSLRGGHFYVKNAGANNTFVKYVVKEEKELLHLITKPCTFDVVTYMPIPKSMNIMDTVLAELGMIKPITTPDWDNLGKTYSDMVQKWLLLNDSLITDGSVKKRYSLKPRVEITITYALNYDSIYNKKVIENSKSYKDLE
jgi:uncharacterized protein yqaN